MRNGYDVETVIDVTKMDRFFLWHIQRILDLETLMNENPKNVAVLRTLKEHGFSDSYIARNWDMKEFDLYNLRKENGIIPVYKKVDTCAGEFVSEHHTYIQVMIRKMNLKSVTVKKSSF